MSANDEVSRTLWQSFDDDFAEVDRRRRAGLHIYFEGTLGYWSVTKKNVNCVDADSGRFKVDPVCSVLVVYELERYRGEFVVGKCK